MFCNKRRITSHVYNKLSKGLVDLQFSEFYTPTLVDDFFFSHEHGSSSECTHTVITSDITMLFNQERLDKMSAEAVVNHFNSLSVRNDSLAKLRAKLSDDELVSIVKSRYIQSPSELLSYSEYLVSSQSDAVAAAAGVGSSDVTQNTVNPTIDESVSADA